MGCVGIHCPDAWSVDIEELFMTKLCDECETVAHCIKHGCIPKQPAPVQGYVTGLDVYLDPADMKPKRYPPAQPAPVQESVAHCEAGPRHCQQCHLEDRSLALAAAVRYVQNNTPKLVSDEICMALTTPPAAQRQFVGLTDEDVESLWDHGLYVHCSGITALRAITRAIEAKLKEKNT